MVQESVESMKAVGAAKVPEPYYPLIQRSYLVLCLAPIWHSIWPWAPPRCPSPTFTRSSALFRVQFRPFSRLLFAAPTSHLSPTTLSPSPALRYEHNSSWAPTAWPSRPSCPSPKTSSPRASAGTYVRTRARLPRRDHLYIRRARACGVTVPRPSPSSAYLTCYILASNHTSHFSSPHALPPITPRCYVPTPLWSP